MHFLIAQIAVRFSIMSLLFLRAKCRQSAKIARKSGKIALRSFFAYIVI